MMRTWWICRIQGKGFLKINSLLRKYFSISSIMLLVMYFSEYVSFPWTFFCNPPQIVLPSYFFEDNYQLILNVYSVLKPGFGTSSQFMHSIYVPLINYPLPEQILQINDLQSLYLSLNFPFLSLQPFWNVAGSSVNRSRGVVGKPMELFFGHFFSTCMSFFLFGQLLSGKGA